MTLAQALSSEALGVRRAHWHRWTNSPEIGRDTYTITLGTRTQPQLRLVPRWSWLNDGHNLQVFISYASKGTIGLGFQRPGFRFRFQGALCLVHRIHVLHLPLVQGLNPQEAVSASWSVPRAWYRTGARPGWRSEERGRVEVGCWRQPTFLCPGSNCWAQGHGGF